MNSVEYGQIVRTFLSKLSALGRLNIRKRNLCASALVSLSDVQPPSVYKSHILNGPINKLYLSHDVVVIQWITSFILFLAVNPVHI